MTRGINTLVAELAALRREVRARATSTQLDHSSLEDAALPVKDADGRTTAIYGKQFDDTYTAASVGGPAPPQPTTPTVEGAVAGLTVTWDGAFADERVTPMDFVRVDVATSMAAGFDAVAVQPKYSFTSPRGGSCYVPLIDGTHYVALVTRTESGRASVQSPEIEGVARKVSGEDIADDYVYPGEIPMDQITSGLINAVIQTAEQGARVRLSNLYGLQVIDADESAVVDFPSDGSRPAQITAELIARSLTALGQVSLRGVGNELAVGADLTLSSGVIPPVTSPTTNQHWDTIQCDPPPESTAKITGLAADADASWWRSVNIVASGTAVADRVERFTADGEVVQTIEGPWDPRYGLTCVGGVLHVFVHAYDTPEYAFYVYRYDCDTGEYLGNWRYTYTGDAPYLPTIGHDEQGRIIVPRVSPSGAMYLRVFDAETGTQATGFELTDRPSWFGPHLRGAYWGEADVGEPTIFVADNLGTILAWDSNGNRVPRAWYNANQQPQAGFTWDGSRFWTVRAATATLFGFSRIANPDGDTDDWWVANTWRDTAGHETPLGPPTRFTLQRRASLILTTPPIPSGADRIGVYLTRSTTPPNRTDFHRVDADVLGDTRLRLDDADLTGAAPPETNTFPDSTPAEMKSRRGGLRFDGAGRMTAPRKMQSGQVSITPSAANKPTARVVTFDQPFEQTPNIVAAPYTSVPGTTVTGVGVDAPSTNGFTLWLTRTTTATTSVYWIALAPD